MNAQESGPSPNKVRRRPSYESAATTPRVSSDHHILRQQSDLLQPIPSLADPASRRSPSDTLDMEKDGEAPAAQDVMREHKLQNPDLVEWDGPDDPENPMNWPLKKKWTVTMLLSLMTLTITFASSVFSAATEVVAHEFDIGLEVAILGTSLFVLGFTFGPLVWGPFSEQFGRMPPLFTGFAIFAVFQIPVAVAQNVETIMLARFFAGFFGCSPLAIVGGAFADFWNPVDRGVAVAIFASGKKVSFPIATALSNSIIQLPSLAPLPVLS